MAGHVYSQLCSFTRCPLGGTHAESQNTVALNNNDDLLKDWNYWVTIFDEMCYRFYCESAAEVWGTDAGLCGSAGEFQPETCLETPGTAFTFTWVNLTVCLAQSFLCVYRIKMICGPLLEPKNCLLRAVNLKMHCLKCGCIQLNYGKMGNTSQSYVSV